MKLVPDKGQLRKIFLIYFQYITAPCYYASNTEWVFNYRKASFFGSEEEAKRNIERLTEYEDKALKRLLIRSQDLEIESRYMLVSDCHVIEVDS